MHNGVWARSGNVELQQIKNSTVLTRTCSTIFLICGSKPMSSMRSASSSTRYVHRRRFVLPASRKSRSRPGVAMQISAPAPQCTITLHFQITAYLWPCHTVLTTSNKVWKIIKVQNSIKTCNIINPFNDNCSKLLPFEWFSAILV